MGRIWEFGAHLMTSNPRETELRRRWYQAHVARFEADTAEAEDARARQRGFAESAVEALALRDQLARNGHVEAFRAALQEWAVKPGTLAFNGYSGQMFVNQLVKRSGDHAELARILASALVEPADDDDAVSRMRAFTDYVESIRLGAHPAPGHSGFLLSYFWGLANHRRWPVLWASGAAFVEFMAGETLPPTPADRYGRYLQLVRELDDDHARFESVAAWWERTKPVFLDPVLAERCTYGRELPADAEARAANAAVLVSVARHLGNELVDPISRALGRSLAVRRTRREWPDGRPRADLTVDWTVEVDGDLGDLGLRLWLNQDGVAIGLRPGAIRRGWYDEVAAVAEAAGLPGFRLLGGPRSTHGDDVGFESARPGEFVYGRWWSREQMADLDVRAEAVAVAAALQPTINELIRRATGEEPPAPDDPLGPLVEEFRTATGYPTPADEEHKADRQRFAALLAKDAIGLVDPTELARIWTTRRYGNPGPQSVLNTTLRDADPAEYDRILDSISYLCWGEGEDADRIDDLLDPDSSRYVRGLGESVIMKFLAITRPERYLPVFPYSGPNGKRRMLAALGLDQPSAGTRGQVQVEANDRLRKRLDRFFPNDPRGMARFLYWYVEREEEAEQGGDDIDPLAELAEQVLVDRQFLDDIVALLEDKGQVIFYGPPGTGKTYLARKLAEALAPDPTRRSLVQFHPSTSYEDFFEGYRPEVGADGQMTYRLVPGPLAQIAARAADAPGKRHVMIIDEINRANLPKVLGELLFLFEYRGEQVRTLYRPDDAFELPANLWFIGTMNTADRSIALVDAALRRRFHFVPFFPGHGPMAGLLERWLERHGEPDWVGELVAMVNDELADALDGPHLQLGPSHFMKRGLDVTRLRRIWEYNVEPFIEDQFFGDRAQIDRFRFDAVVRRYQEESGRDIGEPAVAAVSDLADDLGVPAPGEGDGSAGAMDAPTAESPAPTTPDIADGGP